MSPPIKAASPAPQAGFRKSMRPSSPVEEKSAPKSSRFSIRSLSPAGRLKPSKPSKSKVKAGRSAKPAFSSRFGDSSDEDDDRVPRFQSRFADSDDDDDFELPQELTPVRGIPRRPGEEDGDSTDLEDELSDDERATASRGALTNGDTPGLLKSKHAELPSFEAGKKPKAKRGFFGLGKKKATTAEELSESKVDINEPEGPSIPMPPNHHDKTANRPLTPIGEDNDLEASPAQRARSPKLQRRITPQWGRSTSDSWPLPTPPTIGDEERPQTSDGMGQRGHSLKPNLIKRLSSSTAPPAPTARTAIDPKSGKEVVVGRSGKKKKFQGLRRVFGLND
jgi:hypothetical protein